MHKVTLPQDLALEIMNNAKQVADTISNERRQRNSLRFEQIEALSTLALPLFKLMDRFWENPAIWLSANFNLGIHQEKSLNALAEVQKFKPHLYTFFYTWLLEFLAGRDKLPNDESSGMIGVVSEAYKPLLQEVVHKLTLWGELAYQHLDTPSIADAGIPEGFEVAFQLTDYAYIAWALLMKKYCLQLNEDQQKQRVLLKGSNYLHNSNL
jgi:hypothetical protein